MSLATKKVATVLVGSVLVLALSFAIVTPAKADLLSELQAQVQALLAQIAALGGSTSTSGSGCFAFTMTHQQGDTGGEVMNIQKFLNSHGAQVSASGAGSPGNESAYFGALTKAAVAKWQAANGVSPAAGYWGPVTRAKVASVCATTGGSTGGSTGGTLNGTAGSINVSETSVDVEDQVFTGETEKVLGFDVEASGSDVRVTNVRVRFTASVTSGASDRLSDYASEISIWADGQKLASMSPSSFVRDSSGVYSASIPVSQIVRMGSANEVTFHVGVTAVSSIDSDNDTSDNDWTVTLVQTRYTDPTGATLFDTTSGIENASSGFYVDRVSSSSDVKLRMGEGSGHPKAGNVKVSTSGTTDVTLAVFTLKAEGAAMEFNTLKATTTITGAATNSDMVQQFYLMRGSTKIAEISATSSTSYLEFDLDDTEELGKDETKTYSIVAKVNKITTGTFGNGDSLSVTVAPHAFEIDAKSVSDGKSVTTRAGSITTYTQTLFSEGIQVAKVGESFTHNANATTPTSSSGEFKTTIRVTNIGSNDVYIPLNTSATSTIDTTNFTALTKGVTFAMNNSTTSAVAADSSATLTRVSGGTELTNSVRISGGSSADFQLTVTFNPGGGLTQQWRTQLLAIGHTSTDSATATSFVNATPAEDFRTQYNTVNN